MNSEMLIIIFVSALANNIVLSHFLGLGAVVAVSIRLKTAAAFGAVMCVLITVAAVLTGAVHPYLPTGDMAAFWRTLVFVVIIVAISQLAALILRKYLSRLEQTIKSFLPLLTLNSAVLGAALLNVEGAGAFDSLTVVVNGLACGVGFTLVSVILAAIREKIAYNDIAPSWRGLPIILLTAGLMAMAFFGFNSLLGSGG